MHGVELTHQLVEDQRPVDLQLRREQGLGTRPVIDRDEGVVLLEVADAGGVELACQPVAAVEDDLDLERRPGLDADVHRPVDRVVEIEVLVQALAEGGSQFEVFGLCIAMDLITAAGLDATEDGDEAVGAELFRRGEAADEVLLALRARREVVDAPGGSLQGKLFTGLLDPLAEVRHVVTEVLEQHAGGRQEGGQSIDVGQPQQGADEAKAVETAEGALNLMIMPRYKGLHGVVSVGGSLGGLFVPYLGRRHVSSPLGRGRRSRR